MKTCKAGMGLKLAVFLLFAAFFLPLTVLCLYLALSPALPREGRLLFAGGALLFGGLVAFAAYRGLCLGTGWVEYDAEKVIFHRSRREQRSFRWDDVPGERVQAGPWQGGYLFVIRADGRQWKVGLTRSASGFREFERTLEAAGVLDRIGVTTAEGFKRNAEQAWAWFTRDRQAAGPKPEGDVVLCPDCGGRGVRAKRVWNLRVEKVCGTCAGSGYVPRRR